MAGKECSTDISLLGSSLNIVRKCGPALSDVLQSKFGCVAIIKGVDFGRDPTTAWQRPTVAPEQRFAVRLGAGVLVSVWKADLTSFTVDAVVNAANEGLQHYGGLALALSNAGGPNIQKESNDYTTMHGNVMTGGAVVTDAGQLPCKKIIHAVGPQLLAHASKSEVSKAEPLLERAIRSILDRVKEHGLRSVAIPAISSGLFNFPLHLCADIIVSTVKNYFEKSPSQGHRPVQVLLVNNDEPSVREMERACRQNLAFHQPMAYSQAAAANASAPTVQIGKVLLTLRRGKIEEQQTDVIVNTTSLNRDLKSGAISRALLHKAGHDLQKELCRATISGHVIVTKAYKLKCQEVFHTFCPDKGSTAAQQILSQSVFECLKMAATRKYKSIAFPAIGTGGLGFHKEEAAEIMAHAAADFAQKYPEKMEVDFVIFPIDNDTYKAFEEQMISLQRKAADPNFTQAIQHSADLHVSKPPAPQITLSSPSTVAECEAERWLSSLLNSTGTVTIRNNFIQHIGEQEYLQLSRLAKQGVSIEEAFQKGHAHITVRGDSPEDVAVAGVQVEAMLCKIQREFVREEENAMIVMSTQSVSSQRKVVGPNTPAAADRFPHLRNAGLQMVKLEEVENPTLRTLFDLKKNQLGCSSPRLMFQLIPAQFCAMVSQIGFHSEYAPPADPAYGEGIYFAGTVRKAMDVWKDRDEEYLYLVEAEVLTGNSAPGKPGLILPPAVGTDPQIVLDSVSGGPDISVIFSSYQALPKYIITCKAI